MPREYVTARELVKIIDSELLKHEECENCSVGEIIGSEEDATGCNWSVPIYTCSGVPGEVCLPVFENVINKIRQKYNLK